MKKDLQEERKAPSGIDRRGFLFWNPADPETRYCLSAQFPEGYYLK